MPVFLVDVGRNGKKILEMKARIAGVSQKSIAELAIVNINIEEIKHAQTIRKKR